MKFLNILILFGVAGSAYSGGLSTCGQIHTDFVALLQVAESMVEDYLNYASGIVHQYPTMGSSFISYFYCTLNVTLDLMSDEISQSTGASVDYIHGILNGTIHAPFTAPLDCITTELTSFDMFVSNITGNAIPGLISQVAQSPITASTNCTETRNYVQIYYLAIQNLANEAVDISVAQAALFNTIGQLPLYINYYNALAKCQADSYANGIAELLHMDVSIINAYIADQSITVPPPLSCVAGAVTSLQNLANAAVNQFNSNVVISSPPPSCEPFFTQFRVFANIWYNYVNELVNFATNNSIHYPILTPVFVLDFICELDTLVLLVANATSQFSGVDSEVVFEIINGTSLPPFPAPLDCIANDLLAIRTQLQTMTEHVIPGLRDFVVASTSDTSNCNATYQALTPYVRILVDLVNVRGTLVGSTMTEFAAINVDNLFADSFASILTCLPELLGNYVAAALNANPNSIIPYLKGNTIAVPYPFSCVKIIINILSSMMNQALVDLSIGQGSFLTVPNVPNFRG
ncbi:unnamed protein product [Chironomus riparius]|uniref:Secreted protein n=1 Tax=Chironomus riparius TaxID=315576 RepID=A0A9N9S2P3_9DIPT|nr:unnamed protein product [Chironomus riparius]